VCPGCGTRLHEECAAQLGRCPTIGCAHGAVAAPVLDEKKAAPAFVLYSPNQVFVASVLFSFFGGAALLAMNAWRLGRRAAAAVAVGLSGAALATLVFFSNAVPEDSLSTSRVWTLVAAIAMRLVAGASQGGAYQAHLGQGGRRGSTWAALGVALLATLSLLAPAFAVYVALDATLPDAIYLRVEAEDDPAAERLCTVRVLMAPDDHWAWSTRGYVRTRQGRHDEALRDHDRALRLAPSEALYRARRGHTLLEQGDARGALAELDRAVARDPDDAWSWTLRGTAHERLGDPLAALGDYEQALRLEHDHPVALERRAALHQDEAGRR
jgi:tetratricopeptide (TPR) repeat protein